MKPQFQYLGRALIAITITATLGTFAPVAAQESFPDKPIKLVVGYPPGGGADIVTRAMANQLGKELDATVVVENKPGASGMIAANLVAKSKPDGYTLIMMPADSHSIAPHVYPNITYEALKEFTYLAVIGTQPMALIVNNNVPVNNIHEFIKHAQKQGDTMTFASFGVGSSSHAAMAMLEQYGKFKLRHIPYQGSAPAVNAVVSGHVDSMMVPAPLAIPNASAGKVRMIGIASPVESSVAKGQPFFGQESIPVDGAVWVGIMGPANMPEGVAAKLREGLSKALKDEKLQQALATTGTEVHTGDATPDALRQFYVGQYEKWGKVVKDAKITIEQ